MLVTRQKLCMSQNVTPSQVTFVDYERRLHCTVVIIITVRGTDGLGGAINPTRTHTPSTLTRNPANFSNPCYSLRVLAGQAKLEAKGHSDNIHLIGLF